MSKIEYFITYHYMNLEINKIKPNLCLMNYLFLPAHIREYSAIDNDFEKIECY